MPNHKSEDYKLSAVDYYLTEDKSQEDICKILDTDYDFSDFDATVNFAAESHVDNSIRSPEKFINLDIKFYTEQYRMNY